MRCGWSSHFGPDHATDLTPPGSPPLPLRLVSSGNQTALDAAARAGLVAAGRVEVQWGGVWGGVCSSNNYGQWNWWRDQHAQVVCRQLGYPADGHAYTVGTVNPLLPASAPADQPQFINYLQCNGTEPGLGACRGRATNGTSSTCGPDLAVQVACYSQPRKWGLARWHACCGQLAVDSWPCAGAGRSECACNGVCGRTTSSSCYNTGTQECTRFVRMGNNKTVARTYSRHLAASHSLARL